MKTPRPTVEIGAGRAPGFHVHFETGRGRGSLSTVLAVPREPTAALANALRALHDPYGPPSLDTRLGRLAGEAPEGTGFLVGLEDQVWVFPSPRIRIRRVRGGDDESLEQPQVISLAAGDRIELQCDTESEPIAWLGLNAGIAVEAAPEPVAAEPPPKTFPQLPRRAVVPAAILVAALTIVGLAKVFGPSAKPRVDAYRSPPEDLAPAVSQAPAETAGPSAVATATLPEGPWSFRANGAITSSPLVAGDRVVFGCRDSTLYCLRAGSGEQLWALPAGAGIGSSPRAQDGLCVVGTYRGRVLAVRLESGELVWEGKTGGRIVSSACFVAGRAIIGSHDKGVHAFDLQTGEKRWRFATGSAVRASPEPVGEDRVVVGSSDGSLYCLSARDGALRWRHRTRSAVLAAAAWHRPTGTIVGGGQDGSAFCLDAETGGVVWLAQLDSEINAQPRFAGTAVLIGTGEGGLHALDAATGEARWNVQASRGFDARPLVVGDLVVAPTYDGVVHLLDLASGTVRDRHPLPGEVFASPAVRGDLVYVGTLSGTMHAMPLP